MRSAQDAVRRRTGRAGRPPWTVGTSARIVFASRRRRRPNAMASAEPAEPVPGAGGGGEEAPEERPPSRGASADGRETASAERSDAPAPRPPKASGSSRSAGRSEAELLASLREEVKRLGVDLEAGWTCVVKARGGDVSKGVDPYYISPTGRRFRSRQEARAAARAARGGARARRHCVAALPPFGFFA
jgi:hypothetical protein